MSDLLFVYGSLMRTIPHPMSTWLARRADLLGPAVAEGYLIDLGRYPALVLTQSEKQIVGEMYRLREPESTMRALDRYEGIGKGMANSEYARQLIDVISINHSREIRACWAYTYCGPLEEFPEIPHSHYPDFFAQSPIHRAFARHR